MIDIENLVIDTMANGIHDVHANLPVTRGYIEENAEYPCLVIREVNNEPVQRTDTDDCAENYSRVTYQIDVYSSKDGTARSECRELIKLADGIMQGMKFRRTFLSEPRLTNRSVFRQYARYTAIVAKGVTTVTGEGDSAVETTTFHMYRR